MQRFVPKFLKKTVQAAAAAFLLASTASFGTQGSSSLFDHRQGSGEPPPPKIACPLSLCCFYFECSPYFFGIISPLHHSWRSPPRFPPSRSFTPLCHHPGAESCTGLLNTAQSVCTRYTSCCTSFKSIIIIFLTDLPSQTSPVPTSACRRKRCRVAALLVTETRALQRAEQFTLCRSHLIQRC